MATSSATKSRTKSTFNSFRSPKPLTPKSTGSNSTSISSSFFKSVYLEDWWLINAPAGKGLAVEGFSFSETQEVRLFSSEAIATRHDATTLGTLDGFTISISGFINRSRTHENGFPSKVCNRFQLGFPYDWEEYAARCFGEKDCDGCVPNKGSAFDEFIMSSDDKGNSFIPGSLDDIPVTRTRDLLMSTLDDSGNCALTKSIFDDILKILGRGPYRNMGDSIQSKTNGNDPKVDSTQDDTPSNHKKAKVNKKSKDQNVLLNAEDIRIETYKNGSSPYHMDMDVLTVNSGVATRSMARQMSSRNNKKENHSLNTSAMKGISDLSPFSEVAGNQHQGRVTRSSSNKSCAATLFKEKKRESAIRRSSIKRKNLANDDL